ncbi:MAG: phosphoribosylformylglycinamidine synthase II, partial [Gemmatimonadetes bacterium]|nr:phosphoribosylformylglycinamidine synthase II [Gemmatimonadota bacterium]
ESDEARARRETDLSDLEKDGDLSAEVLDLVGSPNLASKAWLYGQYDSTVRASTVQRPGGSAGVVRIRGTRRAVAATTDCNGRFVYLAPKAGAQIAVAEAARNLVCVGAQPMAITNNLNFGNPLKPHIYHQFREAVLGMAEACSVFETPVTGGNVSFYNETDGVAILPTPVIGMVGVIEDVEKTVGSGFRSAGHRIVLLGTNRGELGGSEYAYRVRGDVVGAPPRVDLLEERALQRLMLELIGAGHVASAQDCSDGGLVQTLVECALADPERPYGVAVEVTDDLPGTALLFGESQGRIVISCPEADVEAVLAAAARHDVPATDLGRVTEPDEGFSLTAPRARVRLDVDALAERYHGALPALMNQVDGVRA